MTEDEIYEHIDKELHGGNLVRSLWTRVYAEADGDETRAKARYIRARANQLTGGMSDDGKRPEISETYINPDVLELSELIIENIRMTATENNFAITAEQKSEISKYSEEAISVFDETIIASLAGMSVSKGGAEKIFDSLGKQFINLSAATRDIPRAKPPNISHKIFIDVQLQAQLYLLIDMVRHRLRPGWAMSQKKRQEVEAYNNNFDKQAWLAVLYIKLSQLLLRTFSLS